MSLDDVILGCLALERQAYAIYAHWSGAEGQDGTLVELLSRLADQSDRHRASLWDLALTHHLTPPPRFELELADRDGCVEFAKFTVRQAIAQLTTLAALLDGQERRIVERIRNEDEAQLWQLLILSPEPRLTAAAPERSGALPGLTAPEPRWRPGIG